MADVVLKATEQLPAVVDFSRPSPQFATDIYGQLIESANDVPAHAGMRIENGIIYDTLKTFDGSVGCEIDRQTVFDGSSDHVLIPEFTTSPSTVIHFVMTCDFPAEQRGILGHADGFSGLAGLVRSLSGNIDARGGGEIVTGGSNLAAGELRTVSVTNINNAANRFDRIGIIGASGGPWGGTITDIIVIGAATGGDRHYRLNELTGTVAIDSISGQNGTYVNFPNDIPKLPVAQGVLLEGEGTNRYGNSSTLDGAGWSTNGLTVSSDVMLAPDGTFTAEKLVETDSGATAVHQLHRSQSLSATTTYTLFAFVKADERHRCNFTITSPGMDNVVDTFELSNATSSNNARIERLGNGWFFIATTFTTVDGGSTITRLKLSNGTTDWYQGGGASGLYAWGMDFKQGAFPSSHVATLSGPVTREKTMLSQQLPKPIKNNLGTKAKPCVFEFYPQYLHDDVRTVWAKLISLQNANASEIIELAAGITNGGISIVKKINGGTYVASRDLIHERNEKVLVEYYMNSSEGIGIRLNGGAWAENTTAEAKANFTDGVNVVTYGNRASGSNAAHILLKSSYVYVGSVLAAVVGSGIRHRRRIIGALLR